MTGGTISPYMMMWQAERDKLEAPLRKQTPGALTPFGAVADETRCARCSQHSVAYLCTPCRNAELAAP